jgi:glycosyltransferase involved in cell wall biosynthesis
MNQQEEYKPVKWCALSAYTDKIIYCSEWIKHKALETYHIDPDKIEVIELGANIPAPTNYTIDIAMDICRLVFIGKNWEKKGGDKVLQACRLLKKEGFPCTLTIIGSIPTDMNDADEDVIVIPFLDKSRREHLNRLCKILSESHFLVLPTVFDAYGIVFCEASAYGVPSIASDVGGVSQPVRKGKNGFLLPPDATAQDYAEKIKTVFGDRENYIKLRASSRYEFETRLNWDAWGERVNTIFEDVVKEWKSTRI